MEDYYLISQVIDRTCWSESETSYIIDKLDHICGINFLPERGIDVLRFVLVKCLESKDDTNPEIARPDELFRKLSEYDYQRLFEIFGFDNAVVLLNFFEGNYPCLTQLNGNGQTAERQELENGN